VAARHQVSGHRQVRLDDHARSPTPSDRRAEYTGTVGGALSLLVSTLGAPSVPPPPDGAIALLEDVTEAPTGLTACSPSCCAPAGSTAMGPAVRLFSDVFATRSLLASRLQLDSDTLAIEEPPGFELHEIIADQRDVLLCEAVTRIHAERCGEDINVAVVYGAAHVAPLVAHLRVRHGYVPRDAEWLQVFSL
jgi:hypothetical protein